MENNKPPDAVAQAIVKAFGLESLGAGNHYSPDRTLLMIDSIWIVELPWYFGADIYIAGVNEIKWIPQDDGTALASNGYRGLLLVARDTKFNFISADPYRAIDLEWPDDMAKSLQSLNMLPHWAYIPQADGSSDDYAVHTYWSGGGEGHASYHNITRNVTFDRPEIKGFLNTILHTIESMAAVYNDDEINQIIKRGRNRFG